MANMFRCAGGGETLKCIAKPFDPNETYTKNDVVLYNNLLYICIAYGVTGEWDSTKWQQTTLEELSGTNPNIFYGIEWLEDEYDSTFEYNTDDTCMHAGLLYICLEDGVTGEWDSSKWKRTYLLDCTKLNSRLYNFIYFYKNGVYYNEVTGFVPTTESVATVEEDVDHVVITGVQNTSKCWVRPNELIDLTNLKTIVFRLVQTNSSDTGASQFWLNVFDSEETVVQTAMCYLKKDGYSTDTPYSEYVCIDVESYTGKYYVGFNAQNGRVLKLTEMYFVPN